MALNHMTRSEKSMGPSHRREPASLAVQFCLLAGARSSSFEMILVIDIVSDCQIQD